jgi:hypothetical protein
LDAAERKGVDVVFVEYFRGGSDVETEHLGGSRRIRAVNDVPVHPCDISRRFRLCVANIDKIMLPPEEFRRTIYFDCDVAWFPSIFINFHR